MILHTIIARGSLIIAEFSDSEEDYSNTIKKRMIEVKNVKDEQKILKDDLYLYAICHEDLKFICLSKEDDDSIVQKLKSLINEVSKLQTDGNFSAQLTQLLHKQFKSVEIIAIHPENTNAEIPEVATPFQKQKQILIKDNKKDSIDFQKKLCILVVSIILTVYFILNNIIITD